jgi:hypothetical protein
VPLAYIVADEVLSKFIRNKNVPCNNMSLMKHLKMTLVRFGISWFFLARRTSSLQRIDNFSPSLADLCSSRGLVRSFSSKSRRFPCWNILIVYQKVTRESQFAFFCGCSGFSASSSSDFISHTCFDSKMTLTFSNALLKNKIQSLTLIRGLFVSTCDFLNE